MSYSIKEQYGVPADIGREVRYSGNTPSVRGTIKGTSGAYLVVQSGAKELVLHPTWKLEYLDENGHVIWPKPSAEPDQRGAPTTEIWCESHSGIKLSILELTPDKVKIEDIAESLSNLCRYNGHCNPFWSVAAHSVTCAQVAHGLCLDEEVTKWALLHDAHEYVIGDISSPVKAALRHMGCTVLDTLESNLQGVIWDRFMGQTAMDRDHIVSLVHEIDMAVLAWEKDHIMRNSKEPWNIKFDPMFRPGWPFPYEAYTNQRKVFLTWCRELGIE